MKMTSTLNLNENVFISDENIGELFHQINKEPESEANKLSIKMKCTKFFIPLLRSLSCFQNLQNYSLMV